MRLRYSLIPTNVKEAHADWQTAKHERGTCFETGAAYGKLLRLIERAHLDRTATLSELNRYE
jgi:hypothetical protein